MKYKIDFGFIVLFIVMSIVWGVNDNLLAMYSYMIFAMIAVCTRSISIKIDELKDMK